MIRVVVGTESALKLRAVESALNTLALNAVVQGRKTESGVPDQPVGFEQIQIGASSRAAEALAYLKVDLGIGIESGLVQVDGSWYDPPCVAVLTKEGAASVAFGAFLPIPAWAVEEIRAKNTELGHVVQRRAGGGEKDPHIYFSNKSVKREQVIEQAVLCALSPIICAARYQEHI